MNWDIGIDIHTLCWAVLNLSVVSDSLQNHGPQHARLLCPWGVSRQECWSGLPCPPPEDLPNPGIEPGSPALQEYSLLSEPPGKPKNTEVGSLSLLKGIFMTPSLPTELPGKPKTSIKKKKKRHAEKS